MAQAEPLLEEDVEPLEPLELFELLEELLEDAELLAEIAADRSARWQLGARCPSPGGSAAPSPSSLVSCAASPSISASVLITAGGTGIDLRSSSISSAGNKSKDRGRNWACSRFKVHTGAWMSHILM